MNSDIAINLEASLHNLLKNQSKADHERLESAPFFSALKDGSLHKQSIYTYLRCLSIIHSTLEREVKATNDQRVKTIADGLQTKVDLLQKDLEKIPVHERRDISPAIHHALKVADKMIVDQTARPLALIGYLYVLEGSQIGGVQLKKLIAKVLNLNIEEVFYFGFYGVEVATIWKDFTQKLNSLNLQPQEQKDILDATKEFFQSLFEMFSTLHPFVAEHLRYHVTSINSEAGSHAIPQDPAEITAAIEVGKRSTSQFPYLLLRFGARGEAFTSSDSCWLVNLHRQDLESIRKNLTWLRNLLAPRGVPGFILAIHLKALLDHLGQSLPARGSEFERLNKVTLEIGNEFDRDLNSPEIKKLLIEFESFDALEPRLGNFSRLLTAAFLEESKGYSSAFKSIKDWYDQRQDLSKEWHAEVALLESRLNEVSALNA